MMLQSACPSRSRIAEARIGSGALTATLSIFGNVVAGGRFVEPLYIELR
jgi:tRNA A58 N-methylase Trm61